MSKERLSEEEKLAALYGAELPAARIGAEKFIAKYQQSDEQFQRFLIGGVDGGYVALMYMGLKPYALLHYAGEILGEPIPDVVKRNMAGDVGYIEQYNAIYDDEQVKAMAMEHADVFTDFDSERTKEYLTALLDLKGDTDHLKAGLLLGFPRNAVEQFVRHNGHYSKITAVLHNNQDLSDNEKLLAQNYWDAHRLESGRQTYTAEHRAEFTDLIKGHFPDMTEDTINYILTRRSGKATGFVYVVGNENEEDRAFEDKVNFLVKKTGLIDFYRNERRKQK